MNWIIYYWPYISAIIIACMGILVLYFRQERNLWKNRASDVEDCFVYLMKKYSELELKTQPITITDEDNKGLIDD